MAEPTMFQSREDYENELIQDDGLAARCRKLFNNIPNIPLPRFEMSAQVAQPLAGATLGGALGAAIGSVLAQSGSSTQNERDGEGTESEGERTDPKGSPMAWIRKGNLPPGTVIGGALGALAGATAGALFSALRKPSPAIALPTEANPLRGEAILMRLKNDGTTRRMKELCVQEYGAKENFSDAILLQSTFLEKLLSNLLLEPSRPVQGPLIDSIRNKKDDKGGRILEDYYTGAIQHTLGVTEICARAIKYALQAQNKEVTRWLLDVYSERYTRFEGESESTVRAFSSDECHSFLSIIRNQYRNKLAHGDLDYLDAKAYDRWCRLCYGVPRLHQWWSLGVAPELLEPGQRGWVTVLLCARRSHDRLKIKIQEKNKS